MGEGEAALPANPEVVFFFLSSFFKTKKKKRKEKECGSFLFPSRFCLLKEDVQSSLGELLSGERALPAALHPFQ